MIYNKRVAVIIPAAGSGKRMGAAINKQFIEINNKPILAYTLDRFEKNSYIDQIIIVCKVEEIDYVEKYLVKHLGYKKIVAIVEGGVERQDSVYQGLLAVNECVDIVLVHDGARPMIEDEDISRLVESVIHNGACILGVKVKDTIKLVDEENSVIETPKRETLYAVQTPQGFSREILLKAYTKGMKVGELVTDDAMMVEKYTKHVVKLVEGSYNNIKITTPEDVDIFKVYLKKS